MGANLNRAKEFAANKVLDQVIKYIDKNPEKNFPRILSLLEKVATTENQKDELQLMKREFENNPSTRRLIEKLASTSPSYRKGFLMNLFVNGTLLAYSRRHEVAEELEGVKVPWTILIDPTSNCNLNCTGCWAGEYDQGDTLSFETLDRIVKEAKEMGIHFIVFSGGEPTAHPRLLDLCEKHDDVGFMMYTNGTLIDDQMADRMAEIGNLSPAISLEGFKESTDQRRGEGTFEKVREVMARLRERGIIFGSSLTVTRENAEDMFGDNKFIDFLVDEGVTYIWAFHYVPVGRDPNPELMLTPEQREMVAERIPEIRANKPLFVIDFWNDGILADGCIAGGERYFHINSRGEVEPCAFAHFSIDNIKDKSLKEVIQSPLFQEFQKEQPFTDNLMAPCPIIDNPEKLREIVEKTKAKATDGEAAEILTGDIAEYLDDISASWHKKSSDNNYGRDEKGKLAQLF